MAIELAAARYRYVGAAAAALGPLDLRLEPGRVVGVAGANESGKSTLCLVAAGVAPVGIGGRLEGAATIDGRATGSLAAYELAQRCGLLFQHADTQLSHTTATVFEEVAFGPCHLGLAPDEVAERVWGAMAAVGVDGLAPRDPLRLSGGQAQLVALASVLAMRPRYLILDEPTSELDPPGTMLVSDALAKVAAETGAGILLVEHKTEVLARIADEVVVLDAGRVALSGRTASVLADPRLERLGVRPPERPGRLGRAGRRRAGAGMSGLERSGPASGEQSAASSAVPSGAPSAVPSGAPSIELEAVSFAYPDGTVALQDVSLTIRPNERVAIVGQNGSGKSTLVRHLNGLLRPTRGRVLLDGSDIAPIHVAELARRVGLAFQNPDRQLFAGRAAAEAAFGPRNLGLRGAELDERVRGALAAVGLEAEAATNPYDLGYSRRKLLALASVLGMRTPVLVLDEPTTGQDARGVAWVQDAVAGAAAEGRTVMAITHDMRFAAECFERAIVMREGRVVADGRPAEVLAEMRC
jgi:energy-coupling factor transporter ATP-binding protein EcfA2